VEPRLVKVRASLESRYPRHERGVVLFFSMIAIIALALAGIALDRAVAVDATVGANMAARMHATLLASEAIERAVATLFEAGTITDRSIDDIAHNYFAARQSGEDARGVPSGLRVVGGYPDDAVVINAADRHRLRYLIERLCLAAGPATMDNCTLSPTSAPSAGGPGVPEPPRTPSYRVTVRVDGPAGAAVFVQAMLSEAASHRRLSWRVLDE
jgi:Tfp pilus assembly protein PilX